MSDFPKGGDIEATRAWLDKKGFVGKFIGWEALAIWGKSDDYIKSQFSPEDQERAEILCGLLSTARQSPPPGAPSGGASTGVKKIFSVSFNALDDLNKPATIKNFTLTEKTFPTFLTGYQLISLEQADGEEIFGFDDLINNGNYHAKRQFDARINGYDVDDEVLEMEASTLLFKSLDQESANAHLHQNLKIYQNKTDAKDSAQFNAIVHGHEEESTFAIVLEAKTKVNPNDIDRTLKKSSDFQACIHSASSLYFTSGYDCTKHPLTHFKNVKRIIPCLAGKHFPANLIDSCCEKGIIPIFPSGARYVSKNLHHILKFLK